MGDFLGWVAACEVAVIGVVLVRLALGPTVSDRVVALNTVSAQATLAVFCLAAFADRALYLDPVLWLSSFSYLGTIVWSRYLERGLL
jgi:multicomponent Na+:H+ antiporter subunit F